MKAESFLTLFQIGVLLIIMIESIRTVESEKHTLTVAFFAFGAASMLLSDLYWLIYGILRPDMRMPFTANEIGEWAVFMLFGSALTVRKPIEFRYARGELISASLFTAANAALWIAWSGEWVQDILTALAFGWFLCCLVYRSKLEGVFSRREAVLWAVVCTVLILAETATFLVPEPALRITEGFCAVLLLISEIAFLVRALYSFRKQEPPAYMICRSFALFACLLVGMYMSSGVMYSASLVMNTFSLTMMMLSLRREAAAA